MNAVYPLYAMMLTAVSTDQSSGSECSRNAADIYWP